MKLKGGETMSNNYQAIKVQDDNFKSLVLDAKEPVLVDLWAEWCGPCRVMGPVVEELAEDFSGKAKITKLNVDENQKTAGDYHVHSIPTLLFFWGGKEVDRVVGAVPKHTLVEKLEFLIRKTNTESTKVK